jgi:hypothetical protein
MPVDTAPALRAATWKRVVATILDLITTFFVIGYIIGWATGNLTENGFNLNGAPALVLFLLMIAYFYIGRRHAGGTLWDRAFRIARPQPS